MFQHEFLSGNDPDALVSELVSALRGVPDSVNLGFIYFDGSLTSGIDGILDQLRAETPIDRWVGSVATGVIGNGVESYGQPAISVLVADFEPDSFLLLPTVSDDLSGFLDASRSWRERNLSSFGVVHGDPRNSRVPRLISGLSAGMEGGFLVGGLSSSEDEDLIQIAGDRTMNGLSGVLFSGSVPVVTGVTQGCTLFGHRHEVTGADAHIITRLDGRPALDVLNEEVGDVLARDPRRMAGYIFAALHIPGSDTGDFLVRNLLGIDPDNGALAVGDHLQEGAQLQFAKRDADTAREDLRRMLGNVGARIKGQPKGALYFSCLGRGQSLFGPDSAELALVREALGDLPLAGFYANGEISHNRLYGYTGVLAVFLDPD
ncbi:MAG: FIST C-terminal domain-containing protein [Pseudomonadota bacterium]|nr:FIST C-terminal domain-containing protein [Pseudomonadota bacterium]